VLDDFRSVQYGFTQTRVISNGASTANAAAASSSTPRPTKVRKSPFPPVRNADGSVIPAAAISAARIPLRVPIPECTRFTEPPDDVYSVVPEAWLNAIANALTVCSMSKRRILATTAAAPKFDSSPWEWNPRSKSSGAARMPPQLAGGLSADLITGDPAPRRHADLQDHHRGQ
jgi:hypothetical protein